MLESVREIHGHVNKQLTNHSSATEREIARWFSMQQFSCSTRKKLGELAMSDRQQSCSILLRVVSWSNQQRMMA